MTMKFAWSFFLCAAVVPDLIADQSGIPVFEVKQIDDIRAAEGKEIKVRGLVEGTGRSKGSGMNFLNFTGGEFTVVIFGRNLKNFTGIDSPYEKPENPDIHIKSDELLPDAAAELILNKLIQKEII